MTKRKLIIVSNRLPVQLKNQRGALNVLPSAGGLVSSVKSYLQNIHDANNNDLFGEVIWVGSTDVTESKFKKHFGSDSVKHEEFMLQPVFITEGTYDKHYNGFCNDTIWPLFHYFPSYARYKEDQYISYQLVNKLFAEKVAKIYTPGDLIWVHDYHLMLLPGMLRALLEGASIGFFLHIPFPSFELFRLIPNQWRKEILKSLLRSDLIGFHTNDYLQHFIKSVRQLLGYENSLRIITTPERNVMTDVFPVSIDFKKFNDAISQQSVEVEQFIIRQELKGLKVISSVDRLDYSKAIPNRLESFKLFLEKNPEYRGRVSYLLVVVPSRDIITKYKENKTRIEEMVSEINGKHGSIGWTPIIYQYRALDFAKLAGLYNASDVGFITPLRDGMNLVAKEYVASWKNKKGVLILSETAGAASELAEAVIVNPTDRHELAEALKTALEMSEEEQIDNNTEMQNRLSQYNVSKWADDFLTSLDISKQRHENLKVKEISPEVEAKIIQDYNKAHSRLILLDYDGTLTPFARFPHLAIPGEKLIDLINRIGSDVKNDLVIISGRSTDVLEDWFGALPVHLVAEHGACVRLKNRSWEQTIKDKSIWKEPVHDILLKYTERCAGSFIEEKAHSLAWHYRNSEQDLAFLRSRELINSLSELSSEMGFQIMEGNKVIEARTRGVDKGVAASIWVKSGYYDFCLALGDDRTDEDMFKVIPAEYYSIRIGLVPSAARYNFKDQKDVLGFLNGLHP